jgi:capsular polysaccharide biosynthesis protein
MSLAELAACAPGAWYEQLEPRPPAPVPPPGWVWPARLSSARRVIESTTPTGACVLEIPGGVVFGRRGHVGPDPGHVLVDASTLWDDEARELRPRAERVVAAGLVDLPGTVMTLSAGPPNHAHSLLQSVPRLELLRRRFGISADHHLVGQSPASATLEALAVLGVPERQMTPMPPEPAYRCDVLRYATPLHLADVGVDWSVRFLHELFAPASPVTTGRRLFVGRPASAKRRLLNEDAVLDLLVPAGFEPVLMEGRSVAEQAEVFVGADVVVAPHGAALANTVFCRPGTLVVELVGCNTVSDLFPQLSWRRGLRHELIVGIEPAPPARWWSWQIDADSVADVAELRRRLIAHRVL